MIWKKSEAEETSNQPQTQPQPPAAPASRNQTQSSKERALIGPSIEIKGDMRGAEDLHIEGRVDGKIDLPQCGVTVGKSGRVNADITSRTIVVMGEVNGDMFGEEQIILRQSSTVHGNLFAPRVTLEDGAKFKGSIDMTVRTAESKALPSAESELKSA
jgi:cytoskeletal protein CcmA (bactofilin family)